MLDTRKAASETSTSAIDYSYMYGILHNISLNANSHWPVPERSTFQYKSSLAGQESEAPSASTSFCREPATVTNALERDIFHNVH